MAISKILFCPVSVNLNGLHLSGPWFFVLPAFAALALFFCKSLVWYHDAEKRRKNGALVIVCILVGWPGSFLWWFAFRPAPDAAAPARLLPPPLPGRV